MRIGLGGGIFGVRAGISNKGVGAGIGPVSAAARWPSAPRRNSASSGGGGIIGFAIVAGALLLTLAWPWFLGSYLAVRLGAHNPSVARTFVGWIFEIPWLALLIIGPILLVKRYSKEMVEDYAGQIGAEHYRVMPLPTSLPPGWYPDPAGVPAMRYWNGRAWTVHRAPLR